MEIVNFTPKFLPILSLELVKFAVFRFNFSLSVSVCVFEYRIILIRGNRVSWDLGLVVDRY